ncbi:hypothetical protein GH714_036297 [Hevea brasiliensis]|uniref:C2 domain-containing protein n=1 Tax=Hevea brasiliensis TaxID=3981 RepID=A0A6A6KPS8_HEVBR|nr:hypothetical protein GH714_036297 [Hevea brasiliensis]
MQRPPPEEFVLKETNPHLGEGKITGGKLTSTYDLVEQMLYLYVRVVKAKDLPGKDVTGSCDPYVEVKLGNYKVATRHFEKKTNPEWNQVFAFSKDRIQSSVLEVTVKDKDVAKDDFIGRVWFDLNEIPKLVPPDSPLAPQCLRPTTTDKGRYPEFFVKVILGNQALRTRISPSGSINPMWNEDLMFVAEEPLILSVEDRVAPNKDEVLGKCVIPLQYVDRRLDHRPVNSRRFYLEKHVVEGEKKKEIKFASRIHMRICLEGGYHVLDESIHYSSDLRPTAKQLWKPSVLKLGILSARGLMPMKTKDCRGTTDAYCVAKYGQKWVRTRAIIDGFVPKWNEQYVPIITIGKLRISKDDINKLTSQSCKRKTKRFIGQLLVKVKIRGQMEA